MKTPILHGARRAFERLLLMGICGVFGLTASAQDTIDAQLAKLKSPDADTRLAALRELQTSIDPRIPEALLPLLADEGNSVRRLAARGVGSRWWQIPEKRGPVFLKALQRNAKSEFEDEQNMVRRGVGLLKRDYAGNMFARSANRRWVVYERHGLPCLIDTKTETEELLGWSADGAGWMSPAWGNTSLEASAFWHPKKEFVALDIIESRKASSVWLWRHPGGLRKLAHSRLLKVLGVPEGQLHGASGLFMENQGWTGDEWRFEVTYTAQVKETFTEYTAALGWDAVKNTVRMISRKKGETWKN
jgi:hypothetical protein